MRSHQNSMLAHHVKLRVPLLKQHVQIRPEGAVQNLEFGDSLFVGLLPLPEGAGALQTPYSRRRLVRPLFRGIVRLGGHWALLRLRLRTAVGFSIGVLRGWVAIYRNAVVTRR